MKKIVWAFLAGFVLIIFSCQKENKPDTELEMSSLALKSAEIAAIDDKLELALSEVEYESDFYSGIESLLWIRHLAGINWGWINLFRYMPGKCPTVKMTSGNGRYPRIITLDYGTGTALNPGRVLKGKIIIEVSAPACTSGATRTVTYAGFVVDSITINGTSKVVYSGDCKTTSKNTYNEDITFQYLNGKEIKWQGVKIRQWTEGLGTLMNMTDDVIEITGSVVAKITNGETYKKEITTPLIRKGGCWYIVKGVIKLTIGSKLVSTLDYGTGDCDDIATLTKGTETVEIELTKHKFHLRGK